MKKIYIYIVIFALFSNTLSAETMLSQSCEASICSKMYLQGYRKSCRNYCYYVATIRYEKYSEKGHKVDIKKSELDVLCSAPKKAVDWHGPYVSIPNGDDITGSVGTGKIIKKICRN